VAYIDASHLEAYSPNLRNDSVDHSKTFDYGVGNFARSLMRNGYLPLLLPEVTPERLHRASLLVCIAPARTFSYGEQLAVREFVKSGGTLVAMAGAEDADATNDLLAGFRGPADGFSMSIPRSPVAPTVEGAVEPEPAGRTGSGRHDVRFHFQEENAKGAKPTSAKEKTPAKDGARSSTDVSFFAAWPLELGPQTYKKWLHDEGGPEGTSRTFIASHPVGKGHVVVIGDTFFAVNSNLSLPSKTGEPNGNDVFWGWLLSSVTGSSKTHLLKAPGGAAAKEPIERDQPIEPDSEGRKP
jgi:hypothetical protein